MNHKVWTLTAGDLHSRDEILVKSVLQVSASRLTSAWRYAKGADCDVVFHEPGTPADVGSNGSGDTSEAIFITLEREPRVAKFSRNTLHWPMRVSEFVDLLNHFSTQSERHLAPSLLAVQAPKETTRTRQSPLVLALWDLTQPTAGQLANVALVLGGTTIYVDLKRRTYRCKDELNPDAIGALTRLSVAPSVSTISAEDWVEIESRHQAQPLDVLLWNCGTHGPASQLLPCMQGANAFALRQWPDLGRVGGKSEYIALSARLMRRAYTVAELTRDTSFNVVEIHAFINACAFCALITKKQVEPSGPAQVAVAAAPSGRWASVFRVLRSALGIGEADRGSA